MGIVARVSDVAPGPLVVYNNFRFILFKHELCNLSHLIFFPINKVLGCNIQTEKYITKPSPLSRYVNELKKKSSVFIFMYFCFYRGLFHKFNHWQGYKQHDVFHMGSRQ